MFQTVLFQRSGVSGSSGRSENPQKFDKQFMSSGLAGGIMEALNMHAEERLYAAQERHIEADIFQRMGKMAEAPFDYARRMEDREPPRHKRRVEDYASDVEEKDKKTRPSMQAKVLFWNRFVAHIRD